MHTTVSSKQRHEHIETRSSPDQSATVLTGSCPAPDWLASRLQSVVGLREHNGSLPSAAAASVTPSRRPLELTERCDAPCEHLLHRWSAAPTARGRNPVTDAVSFPKQRDARDRQGRCRADTAYQTSNLSQHVNLICSATLLAAKPKHIYNFLTVCLSTRQDAQA